MCWFKTVTIDNIINFYTATKLLTVLRVLNNLWVNSNFKRLQNNNMVTDF